MATGIAVGILAGIFIGYFIGRAVRRRYQLSSEILYPPRLRRGGAL